MKRHFLGHRVTPPSLTRACGSCGRRGTLAPPSPRNMPTCGTWPRLAGWHPWWRRTCAHTAFPHTGNTTVGHTPYPRGTRRRGGQGPGCPGHSTPSCKPRFSGTIARTKGTAWRRSWVWQPCVQWLYFCTAAVHFIPILQKTPECPPWPRCAQSPPPCGNKHPNCPRPGRSQ